MAGIWRIRRTPRRATSGSWRISKPLFRKSLLRKDIYPAIPFFSKSRPKPRSISNWAHPVENGTFILRDLDWSLKVAKCLPMIFGRRISRGSNPTPAKRQSKVPGTITYIRTGQEFCEHCAAVVCPTFHLAGVISVAEAAWLRAQGIDPGTSAIEEFVRRLKDS